MNYINQPLRFPVTEALMTGSDLMIPEKPHLQGMQLPFLIPRGALKNAADSGAEKFAKATTSTCFLFMEKQIVSFIKIYGITVCNYNVQHCIIINHYVNPRFTREMRHFNCNSRKSHNIFFKKVLFFVARPTTTTNSPR